MKFDFHFVHFFFYDNYAALSGVAIGVEGTNFAIEKCIFEDNTALTGGAIRWGQ